MDLASRKEFDFQNKELLLWFEKTESALEMLTKDDDSVSAQEQFTVDEQLVLVQVLTNFSFLDTILFILNC